VTDRDRRAARTGQPRRGRKPRRRGRVLLVTLLVVFGLLVAADFGLAAFAEHTVSQKAREKFGLRDDPAVNVHGFPFTTQALTGEYDRITVEAQGIAVRNTLRDLTLLAELREVTAPLSDLIDGRTDSMVVGDLEVVAKIRQADIGRLTRLPDLTIEPAALRYVETGDEEDKVSIDELDEQRDAMDEFPPQAGVRLAATTQISGRETQIVVLGIIELSSKAVRIIPKRLEFQQGSEVITVPDQVREAFLPRFDRTIQPGSLPFGVQPGGVAVENGALLVQGKAKDVRFDQGVPFHG
jgi:hypothetical protein